ncbi:unnamed protein product [Zymoseptoria tritici ST99CH_3D1]|nr:unnamed protein product [Zymoseptoria tritici ST99CH_3D1]
MRDSIFNSIAWLLVITHQALAATRTCQNTRQCSGSINLNQPCGCDFYGEWGNDGSCLSDGECTVPA